jgi:penicillin-binding protein 1A
MLLVSIIVYVKYIKPLPSIKELENIDIAQSSTIFDREGNELYKIYKEKRTYVPYDQISKNMIHAIVA